MPTIRPAAVAGSFYPAEPVALRAALAHHLAQADPAPERAPPPKLLVLPHAGWVYSGDVAAQGYALLAPLRGRVRRVVLLCPTHRVGVRGLAAPTAAAFATPLGPVPLDQAALAVLDALPQLQRSDRVHAQEHAIEVQLPFLQTVLGEGFALVPLAVGEAGPDEVDAVLERLWGGDETLVVVSSDLSHYQAYADARAHDRATVQRILAFDDGLAGEDACGAHALNGALRTARRHGLQPRLLDLRNSGDTAGDRRRVVGYAAIAFAPPAVAAHADAAAARPDTPGTAADAATGRGREAANAPGPGPDAVLGATLLAAARAEVAAALGLPAPAVPPHPRLGVPGATFVTLHDAAGALRGCVGQLEARQPLGEDVRNNALAAAFGDRRFAPLTAAEWPGLRFEVSLLGPLQPLPACASLDEAAARLQPGVDGVLLAWHRHRATFLPQVWGHLAQPRDFLRALLQKAGLALDFWAPGIHLWRYRVTPFEEPRDERPRH